MKLLRGCEKRIYYMKSTRSALFEEAYFVLKKDCGGEQKNTSLAEEADRIIRDSSAFFTRKRKRRSAAGRAAFFSLGAATSAAIIGIASLLIGMI